MSTRNEPRTVPDKIAWIEEQLRKLQAATSAIPAGLYQPGGGSGGGSSGGSGIDHDSLLNVSEDQHHARQHAMDSPLDHTGTISAEQHPVIATGDLHPEYLTESEADALYLKLFIQEDQPIVDGEYLWIETNIGGDPDAMTFWVEDGVA